MADNNKQQLTIWGRANSVNVQKVLWCLAELDLAYQRIDAGMQFGKNNEAPYLAMNPNGRVPTLVDGDFVLWESNSVMRYLNLSNFLFQNDYLRVNRVKVSCLYSSTTIMCNPSK